MEQPYSHVDFQRLALGAFPELREEFEVNEGLLHLDMHAFTRIAQRAKGDGDWDRYSRCIRIANELWARPDTALHNALNVSFLEHLEFSGPRGATAWQYLPPQLQLGWEAMRAYNERLHDYPGRPKPKPKGKGRS
jgi:hypothetical protein